MKSDGLHSGCFQSIYAKLFSWRGGCICAVVGLLLVVLRWGWWSSEPEPSFVAARLAPPTRQEAIVALAFSPNGNLLASARNPGFQAPSYIYHRGSGSIGICDLQTQQWVSDHLDRNGLCLGLSFDTQQKSLVLGHRGSIHVLDLESQQEEKGFIVSPKSDGGMVAISAEGERAAVVSNEATIQVWQKGDKKVFQEFTYPEIVRSMSFSRAGDLLAVIGTEGLFSIREVGTGREIGQQALGNITRMAFSQDGSTVAVLSRGERIDLFDARSCKEVGTILIKNRGLNGLAWHPGRKVLAVAMDGPHRGFGKVLGFVQLWDTQQQRLLAAIQRPSLEEPYALAFSPDGELLAVGWSTGVIELWQVNQILPAEGSKQSSEPKQGQKP